MVILRGCIAFTPTVFAPCIINPIALSPPYNSFFNFQASKSKSPRESQELMAEEQKGRMETAGKHQVFQEGKSMRKSWSTDSLGTNSSTGKSCVCSPTKHQGSFRCRLHRTIHNHHSNLGETQCHTTDTGSFKHLVLSEVEGESK